MQTRSYLGIGSNLANPLQQVKTAIKEIIRIPQTKLVRVSSLYRNPPLGPQNQPDFINAVIAIDTTLKCEALLKALQNIEQKHKKKKIMHWGPRTLDLDILLFGNKIIRKQNLIIPHPGLTQRNFVIYPLLEIEPELCLPDGKQLKSYLAECSAEKLEIVALFRNL